MNAAIDFSTTYLAGLALDKAALGILEEVERMRIYMRDVCSRTPPYIRVSRAQAQVLLDSAKRTAPVHAICFRGVPIICGNDQPSGAGSTEA